ncbi:tetratricopeptide repeat protein [Striga asiatica]|uniref:Tetratricopeptide repeat protein n=1 Tax=Striga asiatica TaxID=4170 RepID=A0A5A7R2C2_STRAF|nr:tetratricopeptide repeat protein [Striga asiatica]
MASTALAASSIFLAAWSLISAILMLSLVRSISAIAFTTSYLEASVILLNSSASKLANSLSSYFCICILVLPSKILSSRSLWLRDSREAWIVARSVDVRLRFRLAWFSSMNVGVGETAEYGSVELLSGVGAEEEDNSGMMRSSFKLSSNFFAESSSFRTLWVCCSFMIRSLSNSIASSSILDMSNGSLLSCCHYVK